MLIEREVPYLILDDWQMQKLGQLRAVRIRARELDATIDRGGDEADAAKTERDSLAARLADLTNLEKILTAKRKDHRGFARTSGILAQGAVLEVETEGHLSATLNWPGVPVVNEGAIMTAGVSVSDGKVSLVVS